MGPRIPPALPVFQIGGAFPFPAGGGVAEWGKYESGLERLLGDAMHARGLRFQTGFWIDLPPEPSYPYKRARADFRIMGAPLLVEADGFAYHTKPDQVALDKMRTRLLGVKGWHVIRFCQCDITREAGRCADDVVREVAKFAGTAGTIPIHPPRPPEAPPRSERGRVIVASGTMGRRLIPPAPPAARPRSRAPARLPSRPGPVSGGLRGLLRRLFGLRTH